MEKKNLITIIAISTICSTILSVIIIALLKGNTNEVSLNDFQVSNLSYSTETIYGTNITGTATVTCPNKNGTYLVIYSKKLISGGTYENIGKEECDFCIVHNGTGTINTYDYASSNEKMTEPVYEINLIGYRSFY